MTVTVPDIQDAVHRLETAHERLRDRRTTDSVIASLAATATRWLAPDSPWRTRAAAAAPGPTGFSAPMIQQVIDLTFGGLTSEALGQLVDRELGQRGALDGFCPHGPVSSRALGPRLIAHVLAGNIPAPAITSLCCGLLLRAGNLVKPATTDPVFPRLFVESLQEVDPDLAALVAICPWSRDQTEVTRAALARAEAVVAYGDDRSIASLRELAPARARFLGYGHQLSLAVVAREALTTAQLESLATAAAFDASVYDQQGCLSPHVFYVEERGQVTPRQFATALAQAMAQYQARVPRGPLSIEDAARLTTLRTGYEFRAESDKRVAVWTSAIPNDWTVVYDDDPAFAPSTLNRFVFVKPTDSYDRVARQLKPFAGSISCVGLAQWDERATRFAADLARLGVHRVCPLGRMQQPPLFWYHDGRPNLADLVRWTDAG